MCSDYCIVWCGVCIRIFHIRTVEYNTQLFVMARGNTQLFVMARNNTQLFVIARRLVQATAWNIIMKCRVRHILNINRTFYAAENFIIMKLEKAWPNLISFVCSVNEELMEPFHPSFLNYVYKLNMVSTICPVQPLIALCTRSFSFWCKLSITPGPSEGLGYRDCQATSRA